MLKIAVFLSLIFSLPTFADIGFDRGPIMSQIKLRGAVSSWCSDINGRQVNVNYFCRQNYLEGGNFSKIIVINQSIDADFVKVQRKGSKFIKSSKFDSVKGESAAAFNLWVGSLFQRPLLKSGKNHIIYHFYKNKKIVLEGMFEVEVGNEITRDCGFGQLPNIPSCENQTFVCNRFFKEYNYCE